MSTLLALSTLLAFCYSCRRSSLLWACLSTLLTFLLPLLLSLPLPPSSSTSGKLTALVAWTLLTCQNEYCTGNDNLLLNWQFISLLTSARTAALLVSGWAA